MRFSLLHLVCVGQRPAETGNRRSVYSVVVNNDNVPKQAASCRLSDGRVHTGATGSSEGQLFENFAEREVVGEGGACGELSECFALHRLNSILSIYRFLSMAQN